MNGEYIQYRLRKRVKGYYSLFARTAIAPFLMKKSDKSWRKQSEGTDLEIILAASTRSKEAAMELREKATALRPGQIVHTAYYVT